MNPNRGERARHPQITETIAGRGIMSRQILIIEDDRKLNDGMKLALKADDCLFGQCRLLSEARQYLKEHRVDLILLDVNLPDGNGIDFVREIRRTSQTPIILITVNNLELDIVTGLEAGANDYITKPFSLMVLRARAAVQLRGSARGKKIFEQGGFRFDFDRMEFYDGNRPVELSRTEQKLLRLLCENRGKTLRRSYLIDEVWQGDTQYVEEHALTVTVKRLRGKLEPDPKNPVFIKTVYGIGYMWAVQS